MARQKNQMGTVQVTLSTTPPVVALLRSLVRTGLYGKNHTEAAERLLAATLERMIRDKTLKTRAQNN